MNVENTWHLCSLNTYLNSKTEPGPHVVLKIHCAYTEVVRDD